MRRVQLLVVGLLGYVGAIASYADLVQSSPVAGSIPTMSFDSDTGLLPVWRGIAQPVEYISSQPENAAGRQPDRTPAAPALPASGTLALLGLGSLAIRQFGCAAQKLHWGVAPDWYHAGGPSQIGHITPFELNAAPVAVADFEQHLHEPLLVRLLRRCQVEHHVSQFIPLAAIPRGPPIRHN